MPAEMSFVITDWLEIPRLSDSIKFSIIRLGIVHLHEPETARAMPGRRTSKRKELRPFR
jgi:hypothetical protein